MKNFNKKQLWKLKESIWKFFLHSGKKHLFLTGNKQIGKTTVLGTILFSEADYGGIITKAVRDEQCTPNYILLEDIHDASINSVIGRRNGQNNGITPCIKGFENTGVCILKRCLNNETAWIVIDEIGFLESEALVFQDTIRACLQEKKVLAVLRKGSTPFLEELYACSDALLIDLSSTCAGELQASYMGTVLNCFNTPV